MSTSEAIKNSGDRGFMGQVIQMDGFSGQAISISELKKNTRKLGAGVITPAVEEIHCELAPEHAAEPIKSMDDIRRISEGLVARNRFRDNMLFIVGINFGLRVSDLRNLTFSNLINSNFTFKDRFPVFEQKTRNTRKRKKNRYVTINHAVIEAVTLYLEHQPNVSLSDYMFRSESNRGKNLNKPLTTKSINKICHHIAMDFGLNIHMCSHTFRKTFCYHQMAMSGNSNRKLLLLQKMLGHSSPAMTLDYIGITAEEIDEAYKKLNLGSTTHNYLVDSDLIESDTLYA